ncbi:MAG: hypothetical protein A3K19_27860 [Lentisphaerae bacterium RIFOXYB12_FULL_65_16]|nr:MAG: hypothetical protein A3K18_25865 [Lentisphaerae bacterium RIFOXYA12_64_32]OGV88180.1 MAG: hypothetical protein A3K19_27860 [Lentisphaerae bacterium RIFOXYB12_FULL_65_16]
MAAPLAKITGENARRSGAWGVWFLLALAPMVWAEPPAVPMTLGKGTGGDGAWEAAGASHSPTTVRVEETAGPEETPTAVVEFTFSAGNYNYNWARVGTGSVDPTGVAAVRFTYRTDVPVEFPGMNIMVHESTGAAYWAHARLPLSPRRFTTVTVPFSELSVPAWSKDVNGKLDVDLIDQVCFGFESGNSGKGLIFMSDVQLVPDGW